MKKVELFIVGQPKSGTTALAQQLSTHPDICISSIKEPNYFATDLVEESDLFHGKKSSEFLVRTLSQYENLFTHKKQARVYGEASTAYLYSKSAAKNIFKYNSEAKIVMVLREPVALMHSLHRQYVNEANEDEPDFGRALGEEAVRKQGKGIPQTVRCPSYLFYKERIKYAEQVRRYYDLFPEENILLFTFDEYKKSNEDVYRKILKLLRVDDSFIPEFNSVHESKAPRFHRLNKALRHQRVRRTLHRVLGSRTYTLVQKKAEKVLLKKQARQKLPADLEESLRRSCLPEVQKVSQYLKRDLTSEWDYSRSSKTTDD